MKRTVAFVRSGLFAAVFYAGSVAFVLLALAAAGRGVPTVGAVARAWARFHLACAHRLLGVRLCIEGTVPDDPVLIAAKHESMFETVQLFRVLHDPAVVAKAELFRIPGWGTLARRYGNIPVERDGAAGALRGMLHAARAAKAQHRAILIFPEGTRVARGEAPPLRSGFAGLYRALGMPVVPVAIDSGRIWPHGFLKRSGTIIFRFGDPIPAGLPREAIEARVHAAINALNDKVI